jgi:hypothetical protein
MIDGCLNHRHDIASRGRFALRKSWRSPIQKAGEPDPESQYKWLHDIADTAAPEIRDAFLKAIEDLRGSLKEAELAKALESGSVDRVLEVLGIDDTLKEALRATILPPLEDVLIDAGRGTTAATFPKDGSLQMRFDISNPNVVRYIQNNDLRLIQQVTDDTRGAVRQIVADALQFGGHPRDQARAIRELVGLTEKQAAAVENFRNMLEGGDRAALTRELRDRRFDPTLDRALGSDAVDNLTQDQIDTMVARYRDRMLTMRAETIARTETINAAEAGKQMAWEQAANNGLLTRSKLRQGWLVTPDDRLCLICAAIPLLNPDGVPLGGYFTTPIGPVLRPTVHPQCRCDLYLMAF